VFKLSIKTCLFSGVLLITVPIHATPNEPLAIVNGKILTQQDYHDYVKARATQTRHHVTPEILLEELIQRELLKQDALKKKLDQHPDFIRKHKEMRESLLIAMAIHDDLEKHSLNDAALKKEYDKQIAHIKVPKEHLIRHILVKTSDEAKAIIAELEQGKDFGELAKEKSIDIPSAQKGGQLGWITKQQIDSNVGNVVEKLEKGQYTTKPVNSQYGWHIVQVDDIRSVALPAFEGLKERIRTTLQSQQMQNYVEGLKKHAEIKILKSKP
jgi:peptidyl-prolyl cis-trans isomerase C